MSSRGGPNLAVKASAQAYREMNERFRDSPDNLNPQIDKPIIGAVRHLFVADTDQQAEANAAPSYRVYYTISSSCGAILE